MEYRKEIRWVGSSRRDLRDLPKAIRADFGFELQEVADGRTPQKKSHRGASTDKADIDLIKARLAIAEADYRRWKETQK
jgi:phage-related protein